MTNLTEDEAELAAKGFVQEYLEREPEFIDVVEYLDEWIDDADIDLEDYDYTEVFNSVKGLLDTLAQRFADADS